MGRAPALDTDGDRERDERVLAGGFVRLYADRRQVFVREREIHLTTKEFDLLQALLSAEGRVVTRDSIMENIWKHREELDLETRTLDVHMHRLRAKLGKEGERIITIKNVGYRFEFNLQRP